MKRRGERLPSCARIVVLSEHPIICAGIRACVKGSRDLTIATAVSDANETRAFIRGEKVHLLLIDLSPPTTLCFTVLTDLHKYFPELPVLILSTEDESLYAERAVRAGAKGYVMEQAGCEAILKAMRHVLSGRLYLSAELSEAIVRKATGPRAAANSRLRPLDALSDREFDVFQLIGHGKSTREIAARLHLSPKTVAVHRNHIRHKLKLRNGAELVRAAIRFCETQPSGRNRK